MPYLTIYNRKGWGFLQSADDYFKLKYHSHTPKSVMYKIFFTQPLDRSKRVFLHQLQNARDLGLKAYLNM